MNANLITEGSANRLRNECHTRSRFAQERGKFYFEKVVGMTRNNQGHPIVCHLIDKVAQARRIFLHYRNEHHQFVESYQRVGRN